jgi:hypothetical protein
MCGLGLMTGPLLGSILIYLGGYIAPFIFFTSMCVILVSYNINKKYTQIHIYD